MRQLLIPLLCLLSGAAHSAQNVPNVPSSVWKGKLGTVDIVACFNGGQGLNANGSYYYAKYKQPIQLVKDEKKPGWSEPNDTGHWTLSAPAGDQISGTWNNPKNGKSLPIALTLIEQSEQRAACAGDAYNRPLEGFPALQTGKTETVKGKKFRQLRIADSVTVELLEAGPAITNINRQLRARLPAKAADLAEYYEKRRDGLGSMGWPSEDETHAMVKFWSDSWVTVEFYRWAAGFGRSGMSSDFLSWDVRSGAPFNPWSWFMTKSAIEDSAYPLPPALEKFLFKGVKRSADCKDDYTGRGQYHVSLEDTGVRFWEDAYGTGCEQELSLPYSKMAPFLTPAGKAALKTFIAG